MVYDPAQHSEEEMLARFVDWGESRSDVHAILLTSSRTVPGAPLDVFSDYDIIVVVDDIYPYFSSREWLEAFGHVLVLYKDPILSTYGLDSFGYVTQYEDGLKIDFGLWQVETLRRLVADPVLPPDFDLGYRILLDKIGLTAGMKLPSHRAYIPTPPSVEEYLTDIELFFHEATYVAKHLRRDDMMAAKYNLDYEMKHHNLRKMLEWQIETEHDWSVKTGSYGRGLKRLTRTEIWTELEATYVGMGIEENWQAMWATIVLFRKLAISVGEALGYAYPKELDERMDRYLQNVRDYKMDADENSVSKG